MVQIHLRVMIKWRLIEFIEGSREKTEDESEKRGKDIYIANHSDRFQDITLV